MLGTSPAPRSAAACDWPATFKHAPDSPRLTQGEIHVWLADLSSVDETGLPALLSDEERARAARFARALDGRLWARARGVLKTLLGLYLDRDPSALGLTAGPRGKPVLVETRSVSHETEPPVSRAPVPLHFNLSHSRGLALFAFSADPVGVDIEGARSRQRDELAIAERVLGPEQARGLEALPAAERPRAFLQLWVRHEAALKYSGEGIGREDANASVLTAWVADLDVGPEAAAAVAAEQPPSGLRCWGARSGALTR